MTRVRFPPQSARRLQLHEAPAIARMASAGDPPAGPRDAADQNFDYMFKLLLIGNSSVGKTSFLFRYADDSFTPAFVSTVGIDFKVKTVYRHDKRIKLQIWVGRHRRALRGCGGGAGGCGRVCPAGTPGEEGRSESEASSRLTLLLARTRRARSATGPSPRPTTAEPWASCLCTTWPTKSPLPQCKTGESS